MSYVVILPRVLHTSLTSLSLEPPITLLAMLNSVQGLLGINI